MLLPPNNIVLFPLTTNSEAKSIFGKQTPLQETGCFLRKWMWTHVEKRLFASQPLLSTQRGESWSASWYIYRRQVKVPQKRPLTVDLSRKYPTVLLGRISTAQKMFWHMIWWKREGFEFKLVVAMAATGAYLSVCRYSPNPRAAPTGASNSPLWSEQKFPIFVYLCICVFVYLCIWVFE